MGMQQAAASGLQSEINVTPMVDIMLVLLIIFMVVTPLLQHGVTVDHSARPEKPGRRSGESTKRARWSSPSRRMASITSARRKSTKDRSEGGSRKDVGNIKKEEDKIVYIKSGVGVSYGEVVNVINEVREKGVDKIGLVADKKKGKARRRRPGDLS